MTVFLQVVIPLGHLLTKNDHRDSQDDEVDAYNRLLEGTNSHVAFLQNKGRKYG